MFIALICSLFSAYSKPIQEIPRGEILFNSNRSGVSHLYIMNASGQILRQVTEGEANHWSGRWDPSGERIWFISDRDGRERLYHMAATGSDSVATPLTGIAGFNISPDGKTVAFYREGRDWAAVFVAGIDGTGEVNLSKDQPGRNLKPAWSPDGRQLTFTSDRDGNLEIYRMRADGSGVVNLSNHPAAEGSSQYSPDGRHILFRSSRRGEGNQEIYVMRDDGSQVRQVTDHPKWELISSWSPKGVWVTFGSNRAGNWEIYLLPFAQSETTAQPPIRLTHDPGFDGDPVWRPVK